jgi:GTPase SAR1 family protein
MELAAGALMLGAGLLDSWLGGNNRQVKALEDKLRNLSNDFKKMETRASNAETEVQKLKADSVAAQARIAQIQWEGEAKLTALAEKSQREKAELEDRLRQEMEKLVTETRQETEKEAHIRLDAVQVQFQQMAQEAKEERERSETALREQMEVIKKEAQAEVERLATAIKDVKGKLDQITAQKKEFEKKWRSGERPIDRVTLEQLEATKKKYEYQKHLFHIAIAGVAGGGKSSLINSFLGLRPTDPNAAPVGSKETTLKVTRYEGHPPTVWFDVPGTGTLTIPDWQYFNDQGLYIFDCIIVVVDNRFTESDVAILKNCKLLDTPIPTFLVRSKSDQHIRNAYEDRAGDEDLEGSAKAALMEECKQKFIRDTKENFAANLRKASLDDTQEVYCVSKEVLRAIICREKLRPTTIVLDERKLLHDIVASYKGRV